MCGMKQKLYPFASYAVIVRFFSDSSSFTVDCPMPHRPLEIRARSPGLELPAGVRTYKCY